MRYWYLILAVMLSACTTTGGGTKQESSWQNCVDYGRNKLQSMTKDGYKLIDSAAGANRNGVFVYAAFKHPTEKIVQTDVMADNDKIIGEMESRGFVQTGRYCQRGDRLWTIMELTKEIEDSPLEEFKKREMDQEI